LNENARPRVKQQGGRPPQGWRNDSGLMDSLGDPAAEHLPREAEVSHERQAASLVPAPADPRG